MQMSFAKSFSYEKRYFAIEIDKIYTLFIPTNNCGMESENMVNIRPQNGFQVFKCHCEGAGGEGPPKFMCITRKSTLPRSKVWGFSLRLDSHIGFNNFFHVHGCIQYCVGHL